MKKFIFVLLLVSMLMLAVAVSAVSAAGPPVHQVSGGGKLDKLDGSFDTFSFVVQVDADGDVRGQGGIQVHQGGRSLFSIIGSPTA